MQHLVRFAVTIFLRRIGITTALVCGLGLVTVEVHAAQAATIDTYYFCVATGWTAYRGGGPTAVDAANRDGFIPDAAKRLKANLTLPQFPGKVFPAVVVSHSHAIDEKSGTLLVELHVDSPGGALQPGSRGEVQIELATNP